jgi:predicted component of type VI protein secretion system
MEAKLVMFKADGRRREFSLPSSAVIGRDNACRIRIPLSAVSRRHCLVALDNGRWAVQDLRSTNGTFVNHERVTRAWLRPGDILTVGPVHFVVVIDGEPEIIQPIRSVLLDSGPAERAAAGGGGVGAEAGSDEAAPRPMPRPMPRPQPEVGEIPDAGGSSSIFPG